MKSNLYRAILFTVELYNLLMLSSSRYLEVYLRIFRPYTEVHFILNLVSLANISYPIILSVAVRQARAVPSTIT